MCWRSAAYGRESRYFSTWKRVHAVEEHGLAPEVRAVSGQRCCPIGDAVLVMNDAVLGVETCEELFTPAAPNVALALSGVEIVSNGSGSHHQARPLTFYSRGRQASPDLLDIADIDS